MEKIYLQISSGRGPAECCRTVAKLLELIIKEAIKTGLKLEVIDREEGELNRTLQSAIVMIEGTNMQPFVKQWEGTVLWISKSPYRKFHKRKNWFVGIKQIEIPESNKFDESQIVFQTLKASGPGGQHVNKTESAVRATHKPSGISVTVSDQRSQHQNKQLAIERLRIKLYAYENEQIVALKQQSWDNHNNLERGNPVKTIEQKLD